MIKNSIRIRLKSQNLGHQFLNQDLTGFVLNYNGINQIVSVHHFLPIDNITIGETVHKIKINSSWSEVLILDTDNFNVSDYKIHKNIQNKIPECNDKLVMKYNDYQINMKVINHAFAPFNNMQKGINTVYIVASTEDFLETPAGISGSPIFYNNKIIGIFSKYDHIRKLCYIIPIYVVIKNLEKTDNKNIYHLPISNTKKINSYNVTKKCLDETNSKCQIDIIFHPTLRIYIPLETYFILEGDTNSKISCQYENINNELEMSDVSLVINRNMELPIEDNIQYNPESNDYILNLRLFVLIHKLGKTREIYSILNKLLNEHNVDNIKLEINQNILKIK